MKKIGNKKVTIFKIKNRTGYAAICGNCLTEGPTRLVAYDRMVKAMNRKSKKK